MTKSKLGGINGPLLINIVIFLFFNSCQLRNENRGDFIELSPIWDFGFGENVLFSDQKKFSNINVSNFWEDQLNIDYDGYAWYRQQIFLPSNIKKLAENGDSLCFRLGPVDDIDVTYLNNFIIGFNTETIKNGKYADNLGFENLQIKNDIERVYKLPYDDPRIKYDSINVITIKVLDKGGLGGIKTNQPQKIHLLKRKDNFEFDLRTFYRYLNGINEDTSFMISNYSGNHFVGDMSFRCFDKNNKELMSFSKELYIEKNKSISIPVGMPQVLEKLFIEIELQNRNVYRKIEYSLPFVIR